MTNSVTRALRHLPGAASVALASGLVNLLGYVLTVVAARVLVPEQFGAFAALLSVIIVGNVAAMAVQAVVARSVAAQAGTAPPVVLVTGLIAGGVLTLAAPAIATLLRLDVAAVVAVAVAVAALAAAAGPIGVAQGSERFVLLAGLLLAQGVLRVVGGFVGLLVGETVTAAMVGVALGLCAAALAGWLMVPLTGGHRSRGAGRQVLAAAAVLLGFVTLSNIDVVLARGVLDLDQSGAYGVGSIITKISFWMPQFIPVMAFARLSQHDRRAAALRLSLISVLLSGVVVVVASAALADPIVRLVAGDSYLPVAPLLWRFALLGALLALAQVTVFSALARRDGLTTVLVWFSLAALVALVAPADTVAHVVTAACAVAAVLVLVTAIRETRRARTTPSGGAPPRRATGALG